MFKHGNPQFLPVTLLYTATASRAIQQSGRLRTAAYGRYTANTIDSGSGRPR